MTEGEALAQLCMAAGPKMARAILSGNPRKNLENSGFLRGLLRTHRRLSRDEIDRLIAPMLADNRAAPTIESTINTLQIIAAYN